MLATQPVPTRNGHHPVREGIVDCDVHVFPRSLDEIRAFMDEPFRFWK